MSFVIVVTMSRYGLFVVWLQRFSLQDLLDLDLPLLAEFPRQIILLALD